MTICGDAAEISVSCSLSGPYIKMERARGHWTNVQAPDCIIPHHPFCRWVYQCSEWSWTYHQTKFLVLGTYFAFWDSYTEVPSGIFTLSFRIYWGWFCVDYEVRIHLFCLIRYSIPKKLKPRWLRQTGSSLHLGNSLSREFDSHVIEY